MQQPDYFVQDTVIFYGWEDPNQKLICSEKRSQKFGIISHNVSDNIFVGHNFYFENKRNKPPTNGVLYNISLLIKSF